MSSFLNRHDSGFEDFPILYIHPHRASEWLPDIPPHLTRQLSESERLRGRLSHIIARHYELEACPAMKDDIDSTIARLDQAALSQIIGFAGAVWHGRTISRLIGKAAIGAAVSVAGEKAYRLAVAETDLAPMAETDVLNGELPSKEAILLDGKLCFTAWLSALPAFLSKRVELKFPPDFGSETPSPRHDIYGPAIVRKCGEAFVAHE